MAELRARDARSAVFNDQFDHAVLGLAGSHPDRLPGSVSGRVLEQVRQDLVDEDRIHPNGPKFVRHRHFHLPGPEHGRQTLDHGIDQIRQVVQLERRVQCTAFDPAQVEHVPHEPAQALGFEVDRASGRTRIFGRPTHVRIHQIAGGGSNARQRRAEIVRDRIEQGGLERVALACHLGRGGLGGEAVSNHRLPELVGCGSEQTGMGTPRERVAVDACRPDRADGLAAGLDRDAKYGQ